MINLIKFQTPELVNDWLGSVALSRSIVSLGAASTLEAELQVTRIFAVPNLWQINPWIGFRYSRLPWYEILPSSFLLGVGYSYSTGDVPTEVSQQGYGTRSLLYVVFEFAFLLAPNSRWSAVTRIHHRSGVFGVFDGYKGGSNYLCFGVALAL